MTKFSAPLFDLRRNAMVGKQAIADFLRRSANYVDPQPPVGVFGKLRQTLAANVPSVNDFNNLAKAKVRSLAYPTVPELLTGGLVAGSAFEAGRNLTNGAQNLGGRMLVRPEELEEVKYSSAAQRAAQAAVKKLRYPYAGPGTQAWQKQVYHPRSTARGTEVPRDWDVYQRNRLLLPRNATDTETMKADSRELYNRVGRRLFPIFAATTGLGTVGVGGISALNYLNRPEGFALAAGNPAHLEGYKFVPDSKYSSIPQRLARGPFRGPGTAAWQRKMYPNNLSAEFNDYSLVNGRLVPAADAVQARASRYLPRNTSNQELNNIYERELDADSSKAWTALLAGTGGLAALGLGGVGLSQYMNQPGGVFLSSNVPDHLQGFKFVPDSGEAKYSSYLLRQLTASSR